MPIVIQRRTFESKKETENEIDEGIEYAKKLFGNNIIIKEEE